uniref:tRNA-splicing endonuclease subunit Sen2 n=2 Tax=Callorhinchus milii TaxID=7868 RepID=V9KQE2_CALMI|eukprot:gi/632970206/ref/XP_007901521.1/ PREDICTED: tRNA-splicing endonuclease subunit Sen2 [Callorhinchus milii]
MAEAVFRPPKRRRRVYEAYEAPFPVPLSQEESLGKEPRHYEAEILNNYVIVRKPDDITALYGQGYFGKGVLSRSRPEYNISDPALAAKWKDAAALHLPIISSKKYQHHVEWAKGLLQAQELEDSHIERILTSYTAAVTFPGDTPETDSRDLISDSGVSVREPSAGEGEGPAAKSSCGKRSRVEEAECSHPSPANGHEDRAPIAGDVTMREAKGGEDGRWLDHELVLVEVEEESVGSGDEDMGSALRRSARLVCRRNPFRIFEYLQLSLQEAFFLVYALGCLTIYHNEEPLSIAKLWEVFGLIQPGFKANYMAYHYFRSKGWVPKTGLKYGTDLLLYRKGPPFYHSSYSVVVEMTDDTFQSPALRPFTWKSLAGLNRITGNVSKELMLCYLIRPSDMGEEELASPDCMRRIKVQEVIVSRWVSSRERTDQDEM